MIEVLKDLLFNNTPPSVILKYPLGAEEQQGLIHEMQRSRFKTPEIFDYLAAAKYKYIYGAAPITIQIIADESTHIEPTLVRKVLRRALALYAFTGATKPLKIIWIPCAARRHMPAAGELMAAEHINGGYTYMNGDTIYIYRYEEFAKVLIHEILHHTYFDAGRLNWPVDELRRVFNIAPETPLVPNEAVVETWAELFQLIFISIETEIPLETLIEAEANHALCQTAKLLAHAGAAPWRERTNAFSYIVFRTIFLCHLPEFIGAPRDPTAYIKILIDGWRSAQFQEWLTRSQPIGCDLRMSAFNNF